MQKKYKVLILGATGFIGKNLIINLHNDFIIHAVSRSNKYESIFNNLPVNYHFIDIFSEDFPLLLNTISPDFIINLISFVSAGSNDINPTIIFNDNFFSLVRLIDVIKKYHITLKLLIQLGSAEEYGDLLGPFNETDKENPNSIYSLSKLTATNYLRMVSKDLNFNSLILRPSNLFGPYQSENKLIPTIINSVKENKPFSISNLDKRREFYFIKDLIFVINNLLILNPNYKGEVFNVGYAESITIREIIGLSTDFFKNYPNVTEKDTLKRGHESPDFKVSILKYYQFFGGSPFEKTFITRFNEYLNMVNYNLP